MITVNSSTIEAIGYDGSAMTLRVKFKNGALYEYSEVPQYVYDAVIESESVGKALNSEVKGKYEFVKL